MSVSPNANSAFQVNTNLLIVTWTFRKLIGNLTLLLANNLGHGQTNTPVD